MDAATKQVDKAVNEGVDSQGVIDRRLAFFSNKKETKSAWLHYMNVTSEYPDEYLAYYSSKKFYLDKSTYMIPLGKVSSVPEEQQVTQTELELFPVFPAMFQMHTGNNLAELPSGYMYIFVDGYLWRELYLDGFTQQYRDVNLAIFQGEDARPYGVESERFFVLLPKRMNNKPCKVEIAFSEVQWCWDYIVKLGGMSTEDPRYYPDAELIKDGKEISITEYESKIKQDVTLRSKRCQEIKLDQYKPTDNDPNVVHENCLMPANLADAMNNHPTGEDEYPDARLRHLTSDMVLSDLPVLALKHPVYYARNLAAAHILARTYLEEFVAEISGQVRESDLETEQILKEAGENDKTIDYQSIINNHFRDRQKQAVHFDMAMFLNQYLYQSVDAGEKEHLSVSDKVKESLAKRKKMRTGCLEEGKFFEFLRKKEIDELTKSVEYTKKQLIDYLNEQEADHCFTYAMYDVFTLKGKYYLKGWEIMKDLLIGLKDHPARQVQVMMQTVTEWESMAERDKGQDFLLTLLGRHPHRRVHKLCECMFPPQMGDDLEDLYAYKADEQIPYEDHRFNPEKFRAVTEDDELIVTASGQTIRRSLHLISGLMANFTEMAFDAGKHAQGKFYQERHDAAVDYAAQKEKLEKAEAEYNEAVQQQKQAHKNLYRAKVELDKAEQRLDAARKQQGISAIELKQLIEERDLKKQNHDSAQRAYKAAESNHFKKDMVRRATYSDNSKSYLEYRKYEIKGGARFYQARGNYMLPIYRLVHIFKVFRLGQVEMTVADYLNGKYPEGKVPFNIDIRKTNAKLLKEHIEREFHRGAKMTYAERAHYRVGIFAALDDLLNLRPELAVLLEQWEAAYTRKAQMQEKIKVLVYELDEADRKVKQAGDKYVQDSESVDAAEKGKKAELNGFHKNADYLSYWNHKRAETQGKLNEHKRVARQMKQTLNQLDDILKVDTPAELAWDGKGSLLGAANIGILGVSLWFEMGNMKAAWSRFKLTDERSVVNAGSAALDLASVIAGAIELISTFRFGALTTTQLQQLAAVQSGQPKLLNLSKELVTNSTEIKNIKFMRRVLFYSHTFNVLASFVSAGLAGYDIVKALRQGNIGAALGLAVMLTGFAMMTTQSAITLWGLTKNVMKNPFGKLGWIGFAIVLVGQGIIWFLSDDELEAWLKNCPWGTNPYEGGEKAVLGDNEYFPWQDFPEFAHMSLLYMLMGPHISIESRKPDPQYRDQLPQRLNYRKIFIEIAVPGYTLGKSELEVAFFVRGALRGNDYERFDLLTDKQLNDLAQNKTNKKDFNAIWQNAQVKILDEFQGYQIQFLVKDFLPWIREGDLSIDIKIQAQLFPESKKANLVSIDKVPTETQAAYPIPGFILPPGEIKESSTLKNYKDGIAIKEERIYY